MELSDLTGPSREIVPGAVLQSKKPFCPFRACLCCTVMRGEGEDSIMDSQSEEMAKLLPRSKDSSAIPAACCCAPASCPDYQQNRAGFGLCAFCHVCSVSVGSPADSAQGGLHPRQLLGYLKWGWTESGRKGD